jgi:hypothetical protein
MKIKGFFIEQGMGIFGIAPSEHDLYDYKMHMIKK